MDWIIINNFLLLGNHTYVRRNGWKNIKSVKNLFLSVAFVLPKLSLLVLLLNILMRLINGSANGQVVKNTFGQWLNH